MTEPVRLLIHGASGRMGQALLRLCAGREDCIVAGVGWLECGVRGDATDEPIYTASESWRNTRSRLTSGTPCASI